MKTVSDENWDRFFNIQWFAERPFLGMEALRFLLGDKIGSGQFRAVYSFDFIPNSVIKVCTKESPANIIEMEVWKLAKGTTYEKWFAPCLYISPEGSFLIQKKCKPIPESGKLPKNIPSFFADVKRANWGYIGKQLVCHDYQFIIRALDIAMNSKREVSWK